MPKRLLLALAAIAVVISAACHSSTSTTPTPSYSPISPSPNPSIRKATVEVTVAGTPVPQVPVEISTPRNPGSPRPGHPFLTETTGKKGLVHFHDLKPSKTYCWLARISPSFRSSECADWAVWQTSIIMLGN
ncbi:MAG TPA: hypothetical protein VKE42_10695 [Candidatus Cybelea sp.]|nr:hypothetical protein [Candidatus Cybelea sp.]